MENNFEAPFSIIQKFCENCDKKKNCSIVNIDLLLEKKVYLN